VGGTDDGDLRTGEQGGGCPGIGLQYPGSKGSLLGLKQALVSSRKAIRALPPSSVPKRVARERSGAMGVRWEARARAYRGARRHTMPEVSAPPFGHFDFLAYFLSNRYQIKYTPSSTICQYTPGVFKIKILCVVEAKIGCVTLDITP
jgi:hypothetical protein